MCVYLLRIYSGEEGKGIGNGGTSDILKHGPPGVVFLARASKVLGSHRTCVRRLYVMYDVFLRLLRRGYCMCGV